MSLLLCLSTQQKTHLMYSLSRVCSDFPLPWTQNVRVLRNPSYPFEATSLVRSPTLRRRNHSIQEWDSFHYENFPTRVLETYWTCSRYVSKQLSVCFCSTTDSTCARDICVFDFRDYERVRVRGPRLIDSNVNTLK